MDKAVELSAILVGQHIGRPYLLLVVAVEHALCLALSISESIDTIHTTPGSTGTHHFGTNTTFPEHRWSRQLADAAVDYVVGEAPLCDGLADRLLSFNIPCFGPQQIHAELEGSKLFAKKAMDAAGVPTAEYDVLNASSNINACLDIRSGHPWVIKRDVLAGGKGVVVTSDRSEAIEFIEQSIETDGHVFSNDSTPGEEAVCSSSWTNQATSVCLRAKITSGYDGDERPTLVEWEHIALLQSLRKPFIKKPLNASLSRCTRIFLLWTSLTVVSSMLDS